MMRKSVAEIVTDQIIERLEKGVIPWKRPWVPLAGNGAPCNLITGNFYRGINVFILACKEYTSPYWLTFKQADHKGGRIKKGEKGTTIVYWKWVEVEDRETGEEKEIPFLREYKVFNLEQTEGIEPPKAPMVEREFSPIQAADNIIDGMPNRPEIRHIGNKAEYNPISDIVNMPPKNTFRSEEGYYCTKFHELTHSSGHPSRLARKGVMEPSFFGSHEYSKEELVAEMGAAFLCAEAGIEQAIIDNSAAYIKSWLKALQNDKYFVIAAAGQAQKAVDFILNRRNM